MHDIVRAIQKVGPANTLEETAAAMIDVLVFICTHCTAEHFAPIYETWDNLVMATFNYVHIIVHNRNDEDPDDSEIDEYETWTHEHINDDEETTIAETAWLMEAYRTLAPLKQLLNNSVCKRNANSLRSRLDSMREAQRCVLLAMTHKNYNKMIARMLSADEEEVTSLSITPELTRIESGESSVAIATLSSEIDISTMKKHNNHQETVVSAITNYLADSYWTALRNNYTVAQGTKEPSGR